MTYQEIVGGLEVCSVFVGLVMKEMLNSPPAAIQDFPAYQIWKCNSLVEGKLHAIMINFANKPLNSLFILANFVYRFSWLVRCLWKNKMAAVVMSEQNEAK